MKTGYHKIFAGVLLLLLHCQTTLMAQRISKDRPPNVIVILVDDLGWTDTRCYGSTFYETPNIDALAAKGIRFTNAYSTCTVCSPSRASILTGKYPARLHLTDWIKGYERPFAKLLSPEWKQYLPLEETTIAEVMKQQRYATAMIGKWHLGDDVKYYPEHQGFNSNIGGTFQGSPPSHFAPYRIPRLKDGPAGEYLSDRLTDEALNFITAEKSNPFFLYLSFYAVHTPLQAKKEQVQQYKSKIDSGSNHQNPVYAAMIKNMDENLGRVTKLVEQLGLASNTLIIFTSDNGGLVRGNDWNKGKITSNTPLRGGKGTCYEGGTRVPLICSWKGKIQEGIVNNEPVIGTDLFTTIAQVAGKTIAAKAVDGVNISPLLFGSNALNRDALYWHYPHYHAEGGTPYSAIRQGDWKLIFLYETGKKELYNLKNDIGEQNDLSIKEPERTERLYQKLTAWKKTTGAQDPVINIAYDSKRQKEGAPPKKRSVIDPASDEEN